MLDKDHPQAAGIFRDIAHEEDSHAELIKRVMENIGDFEHEEVVKEELETPEEIKAEKIEYIFGR